MAQPLFDPQPRDSIGAPRSVGLRGGGVLLTGGQIVAESLVRQGVPYLLGIPGHGCLALLDAFIGRTEVEVLQVRH